MTSVSPPSNNPTPVALITGAGRKRLGHHIALALADRRYALAIHYHRSRDEAAALVDSLQARGLNAAAFGADMADDSEASRLVDEVLDRFGRLDLLVNTAAIWEPAPLESTTAHHVRRHFEINVLGPFLIARKAGLAMVAQPEGGSIINFGDWATVRPYQGYAAYFLSKGTIPTLTRTLAVELALRNPRIRVNAILPGPAMLPEAMAPAERQEVIDATLLHREGTPEAIARAVLYLVDNDFVTGTCLPVDGGRSIYAAGL